MQVVLIDEAKLQEMLDRAAAGAVAKLRDDLERKQALEIMTKAELADYLRCDISKINRYMKKGMPHLPFGSTPRFRKTDIDRWLDDLQKVQGKEDLDSEPGLEQGNVVCMETA